jgi:hypothetical protein
VITPKTIVLFLLGNRRAIQKVAASPLALVLGGLFIIAAGLARNYDHHILKDEPLWILGPIGMSLFSSLFIFGFIRVFGRLRSEGHRGRNYRAFLSCFVMTAPLAWLYGIPFEQHTDLLTATKANFVILLLVSVWRLALTVRFTSVLFNFSPARAFTLVTIPASFEMVVATFFKSISIVGIMGGMRLSESDRFLREATGTVTFGSLILFASAVLMTLATSRGDARGWTKPPKTSKPSVASWILAVGVIGLWSFIAIKPQTRLQNRQTIRELIGNKDFEGASDFLNTRTRDDFPIGQYFLDPNQTSYWRPSLAVIALTHWNDWPEWAEQELYQDLRELLDDQDDSWRYPGGIPKLIFQPVSDAPYLEEVSRRVGHPFTRGDFKDPDESGEHQPE